MFQDHFGIEENPFANTPDPQYLFMSPNHKEALAHLVYGVNGQSGFVLLTGEIGIGKTTLCRYLADNMPQGVEFALCVNPRQSEAELLETICDEMNITVHGSRSRVKDLTDSLNAYLLDVNARGGRAVVIIDEAQNLGFDQLEQVRLLTNLETAQRKLLQIILVGQPELKDRIDEPDLVQLSQRITARYHLPPMSIDDVENYIRHRLNVAGLADEIFSPEALNVIRQHARGVPRLINSICERCMLGAYAGGRYRIDGNLAERSAQEVLGHWQPASRAPSVIAVLVAAIVFVAGIAYVALDPNRLELIPQISNSETVRGWRDTVRQWPGIGGLFTDPTGSRDLPSTSDIPSPES